MTFKYTFIDYFIDKISARANKTLSSKENTDDTSIFSFDQISDTSNCIK